MHKLLSLVGALLIAISFAHGQTLTTSTLPIVVIETFGGQEIPDAVKIMAKFRIVANDNGTPNAVTGPFNAYDGFVGIETRGQTSQFFSDKKPYGFELRDSVGTTELPSQLLGMPKESDWVLLSPYSDKSLIRDVLAFEFARRFTAMAYAPRTRMVEVVVNGEYRGVYVLAEKIKRDDDRVNVTKLSDNDPSGGYIIKLDKGDWWESWASSFYPVGVNSGQQIRFYYHYPKPDDVTAQQKDYIQDFMFQMESALQSNQFQNPTTGYTKYLDRASFIDFMLMNEVSRNVDGYRISSYFYKDRDTVGLSKLHAGPAWDFNIAFGNANYCLGETTTGWAWDFNQVCPGDGWVIPFWWKRLMQDSNYLLETQARWSALRSSSMTNDAVVEFIDSLANLVAGPPAQRNFTRWPILGTWQWPNYYVGQTHLSEVDYLKNWTLERLGWMDQAIAQIYVGIYDPKQYFVPVLFPNPVASGGKLNLDAYLHINEPVYMTLTDLNGRTVFEHEFYAPRNGYFHHEKEMPSLSPGLYICQIRTADGTVLLPNGKLVVR